MAVILGGFAWSLTIPCQAEPTDDVDFAALQAGAKKTFREGVAPFVKTYCADCHGEKKHEGRDQFCTGLKNPGTRGGQAVEAGARQREGARHAAGRRGEAADG